MRCLVACIPYHRCIHGLKEAETRSFVSIGAQKDNELFHDRRAFVLKHKDANGIVKHHRSARHRISYSSIYTEPQNMRREFRRINRVNGVSPTSVPRGGCRKLLLLSTFPSAAHLITDTKAEGRTNRDRTILPHGSFVGIALHGTTMHIMEGRAMAN